MDVSIINKFKSVPGYIAAVLICILLMFPIMGLDQVDLSVPLDYRGDVLYYATMIKGMIENGWYFHNPAVGMPSGLLMYDALNSDNFNYLTIKGITFFKPDGAASLNLYFLLTFPLTTLFALLALRQFKINYLIALVMALLYTFLPYHFYRGEAHIFLSAYYLVPLTVLLVFRVWQDERLKGSAILLCILIASSVVYYAFFTCFFLAMAGAARFFKTRQIKSLTKSALLILCILLASLINLSPTLVNQVRSGKNPEAIHRTPAETETFGLKIIQLLLPIPHHRIKAMGELNSHYTRKAPLINENQFSALGMTAAVGFLILIFRVFYLAIMKRENTGYPWTTIDFLGFLNIGAVLLALTSGFGPLLSMVFPSFRCLNRISIYIAFFSFMAVGLLLQRLFQKLFQKQAASPIKKTFFYTGLALLLMWGLYDQTTPKMIPDYNWVKSRFDSDRDFIHRIESQLPPGAMVFQLPYFAFPEDSFKGIAAYGHFRAYLHSRSLRWSYGAMKGREGDAWQRRIILSPMDEFLEILVFNDFKGIYLNRVGLTDFPGNRNIPLEKQDALDRIGFPDRGVDLEQKLETKLQCVPLVSQDRTLCFYNMEKYIAALKQKYSPAQWQSRVKQYKFQ